MTDDVCPTLRAAARALANENRLAGEEKGLTAPPGYVEETQESRVRYARAAVQAFIGAQHVSRLGHVLDREIAFQLGAPSTLTAQARSAIAMEILRDLSLQLMPGGWPITGDSNERVL